MTLTNEEKAKVFAMYWDCEIFYPKNISSYRFTVDSMALSTIVTGLEDFKLILTPLSSITDEHAIELSFVSLPLANLTEMQRLAYGKKIAMNAGTGYNRYMYLISKGYDVPLWFGAGHPLNGKTAIQLGIAIDKTKI